MEISMPIDRVRIAPMTVAKLREAILHDKIWSGPGLIAEYMPSERQLDNLCNDASHAVRNGQVIDFGFWPNEMIKNTSRRAGRLYNSAALGQPFASSWILVHTWDATPTEQFCTAYLIKPFSAELGCGFEACVLESFFIDNEFILGIGDRLLFNGDLGSETYNCSVVPAYKRFPMSEIHIEESRMHELTEEAAASNVLDPLMTGLMILNTRGVKQEIVTVSDKLNKARVRNHKPVIPPYRKVNSTGYVTAFQTRQERANPPGAGTHASPVPHIRIGHWRNYQTGIKSWISDTLVNVPQDKRKEFKNTRSHYNVR